MLDIVLQEKIDKRKNILIDKKLNYRKKKVNQYNLLKVQYYIFNLPNNFSIVFYI